MRIFCKFTKTIIVQAEVTEEEAEAFFTNGIPAKVEEDANALDEEIPLEFLLSVKLSAA